MLQWCMGNPHWIFPKCLNYSSGQSSWDPHNLVETLCLSDWNKLCSKTSIAYKIPVNLSVVLYSGPVVVNLMNSLMIVTFSTDLFILPSHSVLCVLHLDLNVLTYNLQINFVIEWLVYKTSSRQKFTLQIAQSEVMFSNYFII